MELPLLWKAVDSLRMRHCGFYLKGNRGMSLLFLISLMISLSGMMGFLYFWKWRWISLLEITLTTFWRSRKHRYRRKLLLVWVCDWCMSSLPSRSQELRLFEISLPRSYIENLAIVVSDAWDFLEEEVCVSFWNNRDKIIGNQNVTSYYKDLYGLETRFSFVPSQVRNLTLRLSNIIRFSPIAGASYSKHLCFGCGRYQIIATTTSCESVLLQLMFISMTLLLSVRIWWKCSLNICRNRYDFRAHSSKCSSWFTDFVAVPLLLGLLNAGWWK